MSSEPEVSGIQFDIPGITISLVRCAHLMMNLFLYTVHAFLLSLFFSHLSF